MSDYIEPKQLKTPPFVIVYDSNQKQPRVLKQHTPFAIALAAMAYRDMMGAVRNSFKPKEEDAHVPSEWIFRHTYAVSRETGVVAPLDYWKYPWQPQILDDPSHRICCQKSTQIGISEICLRKGLWFILNHDGTSMMYTLPNDPLATIFSDMRVDPVIEKSPRLRDALGSTDNYGRKAIQNSWLHIIGSWTKLSAQSTPVDILFVDEEDFSQPNIRTSLNERLTSSVHDYTIDISIPLFKGKAINRLWMGSTRNRWMIVCHNCTDTAISLDKEELPNISEFQQHLHDIENATRFCFEGTQGLDYIKETGDEELDYVCPHCEHPLDRRYAHWEYDLSEVWEKTKGGMVGYWSGYKLNQFSAPFISAANVLDKQKNYREGIFSEGEGFADFSSHVCAEPPGDEEGAKLPGKDDMRKQFLTYKAPGGDRSGECSVGIDWGKNESWAVVSRPFDYEDAGILRTILALIRVSTPDTEKHAPLLARELRKYNPGILFADFGYGAIQNRQMRSEFEEKYWEVISSNPSPKQMQARAASVYKTRYDSKAHQVHAMATTMMRRHIRAIFNYGFYVFRQPVKVYMDWLNHHDNLTLQKERIEGTDLEITTYGNSGPDHFCRAACYDLMAYELLRRIEMFRASEEEEIRASRKPRKEEQEEIEGLVEAGGTRTSW